MELRRSSQYLHNIITHVRNVFATFRRCFRCSANRVHITAPDTEAPCPSEHARQADHIHSRRHLRHINWQTQRHLAITLYDHQSLKRCSPRQDIDTRQDPIHFKSVLQHAQTREVAGTAHLSPHILSQQAHSTTCSPHLNPRHYIHLAPSIRTQRE